MSEDPRPRRIALVIDYALGYLGGAQSAYLDEARLLREAGHEVTLVAPVRVDEVWPDRWAEGGSAAIPVASRLTVPVVDLPLVRNSLRLRHRLDREFAARGIDVVHVHSEFGIASAAVSVARRRGLATAETVHTFFWQARMPRLAASLAAPLVRLFGRVLRGFPPERARLAASPLDSALRGLTLGLARRVDVVLSPSAHQAERLREAGLTRVAVVPNALAPGEGADGAPGVPLDAVGQPLRLVWVGRLVPEKRLLEWIDAVCLASAQGAALEVEVIGEGPLRAEAERRAAGLPVRFAGRMPRAAVQERMRAAHLVALTSFGFDNQPVTIVEALHARRGVFYVDPALTEGVDLAGVRASSPEPQAMAEQLVALAADPGEVLRLSERAAAASAVFAPEAHIASVLTAYPPPR